MGLSYDILIADDHPLFRSALRQALAAGLGESVTLNEVGSIEGLQAQLATRSQWDLVLLDLNMPRMSGKEVLAELYRDARLRAIPVVVFTTSSAQDDIEACYDLEARSYIRKPSTFSGFKRATTLVARYWLDTVQRPRKEHA